MPVKKHSAKVRRKAFKLWRANDHNCLRVSKLLKEQGINIAHVTIGRWSESEDWEAKEALAQNELHRIMRQSDDPVLRELVMDDLEWARFLRQLSSVLITLFNKKRGRQALLPKSLHEAIEIGKFIRSEREILLGTPRPTNSEDRRATTIIDNRKQVLKLQLEGLAPEQKRFVLAQARGIFDQDSEHVASIRKQVMDGKAKG